MHQQQQHRHSWQCDASCEARGCMPGSYKKQVCRRCRADELLACSTTTPHAAALIWHATAGYKVCMPKLSCCCKLAGDHAAVAWSSWQHFIPGMNDRCLAVGQMRQSARSTSGLRLDNMQQPAGMWLAVQSRCAGCTHSSKPLGWTRSSSSPEVCTSWTKQQPAGF